MYDADWYDKAYSAPDNNESLYYPMWDRALSWTGGNERIGDLGCGPGLFAQRAIEAKKRYTFGCDFSPVAIDQARTNNPNHVSCFSCLSLYHLDLFDYDVAVLLEVLEHLEFDCKVLARLPGGMHTVFSVPSFYYPGHFRIFPTEQSVKERYKELLEIRKIKSFEFHSTDTIWLVDAVRNPR